MGRPHRHPCQPRGPRGAAAPGRHFWPRRPNLRLRAAAALRCGSGRWADRHAAPVALGGAEDSRSRAGRRVHRRLRRRRAAGGARHHRALSRCPPSRRPRLRPRDEEPVPRLHRKISRRRELLMTAVSTRDRVLARFAMLLFAALIALGFSLAALIKHDITTGPLNAIRFLLGTLVMGVIAFAGARNRFEFVKAPWRFAVIGLLSAVYFITNFIGLTLARPVAISAEFTLIPLMSAAIAFALMRQRAGPVVLLSLVLAGLGSIWVIFQGSVAAIL